MRCGLQLKFHGTDTDTDTDTDFLADFGARIGSRRGVPRRARQSACLGARSRPTAAARAPRSARHEPNRLVRGLLSDARFSSRGCALGMRACTRVRVLYMINYRVHVYKITR